MPDLLRHDRGAEFKNILMQEYCALVGVGRRLGTPWRPVEQGLVENSHKQTQRIMGIMVADVFKCMPNEVGELLHVIEFIVYNTPGPHGYTPRDIDRRWSLATPLEKDLSPFQIAEFEPVSEYIRKVFRTYRELKVKVLTYLQTKSVEGAEYRRFESAG